jgi:hypothetical protein
MLNRYRNSDPFATLHSFYLLASAFGLGQLTVDKMEIKDFPKLPLAHFISAKSYMKWRFKEAIR